MKPYKQSAFYNGEGVLYDIVNEYESRQNPNILHITNTWDYRIWFRYFLQRVYSLFIFDNLPEFWKTEYIYPVLFLQGNFAVFNSKDFGIIPQSGFPSGLSVFYMPTKYIVTNPALGTTDYNLVIGKDCEIVTLTPDWCGIGDLINSYAQRVALLLSDVDVASAMSKFGTVFTAKNKAGAESFKAIFDDIMCGKLAVVTNQSLYDSTTGKELYSQLNTDVEKSMNVVISALSAIDKIKKDFDCEIGLYHAPDKKERLITDEIVSSTNGVMSKCELWLEKIQEGFSRVNRMFNLDIKVRLRYPRNGGYNNNEADNSIINNV